MQITQKNFPETIQVGDVTQLKSEDFTNIDLMFAGSPCQGFSFAGKQLAFDDPRSKLFFEFVRLLKEVRPKYFLLENVRMKKEYLDVISEQVGAQPTLINSSLLSAQSRQRYYWTNIPFDKNIEDKGIVLKDILETEPGNEFIYGKKSVQYMEKGNPKWQQAGKRRADRYEQTADKEKSFAITANWHKGVPYNYFKETKPKQVGKINKGSQGDRIYSTDGKGISLSAQSGGTASNGNMLIQVGIAADIKGYDIIKRVYSPEGKSPTLTTMGGGHREPKVAVQSYREVRTEEAKQIRKMTRQKTGKDHTPYRSKRLEPRTDGKVGTVTPSLNNDHKISIQQVNPSREAAGKQPYIQNRVFSEEGKSHALTASFASRTNVETKSKIRDKSKTVRSGGRGSYDRHEWDSVDELHWRKLTPLECERLQTVPDNYTEGVSNTQRYKMLGNGWTVDVIAHILKSLIKS
jgi:site-specific DNA-cytosine methylase